MIDFEKIECDIVSAIILIGDYDQVKQLDNGSNFGSRKGKNKRFFIGETSYSRASKHNANAGEVATQLELYFNHGDRFDEQQKAKWQLMNDAAELGEILRENSLKKNFKSASTYIQRLDSFSTQNIKSDSGYSSISLTIVTLVAITNRS